MDLYFSLAKKSCTKTENKLTALLIYGTTKPSNVHSLFDKNELCFLLVSLHYVFVRLEIIVRKEGAEIKINPNQFQHQTEQTIY